MDFIITTLKNDPDFEQQIKVSLEKAEMFIMKKSTQKNLYYLLENKTKYLNLVLEYNKEYS